MAGGSGDKKSTLRSHTITTEIDIEQVVDNALAKQAETFEKLINLQADAYKQCLQCYIESANSRMDAFMRETTKDFCELRASLEYTQKEVADLKSVSLTVTSEGSQMQKRLDDVSQKIQGLTSTTDYLENQSRRNNLRIDGIPEIPKETWEQTEELIKDTLISKLHLSKETVDSIEMERAHRIASRKYPNEKPRADKPRTVVLKLTKFKDKELIIKQAKDVKSRGLFVNEDFSQRVLDKRRELLPEMKKAREAGKIAYLSYDRLVVKGDVVKQK